MDKIKHIIITACNAKYGDFLINHWLRSLKDNVNLENIDVLVIDYGLTKKHIEELKKQKIILYKGRNDGLIINVRFTDIVDFLEENDYDQVLSVDGGDLIFQSDISHIFDKNKDYIRIVSEQYFLSLISKFLIYLFLIMNSNSFSREKYNQINKLVNKNGMINAGFILAPSKEFKKICIDCHGMIKNQYTWGADQLALNYLIYNSKFKKINSRYNFIPVGYLNINFNIKKGVFYINNEPIPIIHNPGRWNKTRPVKTFGYGEGHNKLIFPFNIIKKLYSLSFR